MKIEIQSKFSHEGINNKELYESILKCDVEFNQLHNEISLPIDLSKKNWSLQTLLFILFLKSSAKDFKGFKQNRELFSAARRILLQAGDEFPDIKEVAFKLHMSESTLRRRLKRNLQVTELFAMKLEMFWQKNTLLQLI